MKRIFALLAIAALSAGWMHAASPADSIRRAMSRLQGKELLDAHSNLCRLASAGRDAGYELGCIHAFLAEARRQRDAEAEGMARSMLLNCYYNYGMGDSIVATLPAHLAAMEKNQTWDYYYNAWNTLVESYQYHDKMETALREAKRMYADARRRNNNYGLGVSTYCMGGIYEGMGQLGEAAGLFGKSIAALSEEEDISLLLVAYEGMSRVLDGLHQYERLRTLAAQWKATLDAYQRKATAKGYTPSLGGYYLYCTLAAAVAEIETGHSRQATALMEQARRYAGGRKEIAQYKLLQVEARYYAAMGQYDKAIECNAQNMRLLTAVGDSVSLLTVELQQAGMMAAAGRYPEAVAMYQQAIRHKDKLEDDELARRLNELRTIFDVDRLTLEKQIATGRLYLALAAIVLLLAVIFLNVFYTRRLRKKNRVLYDSILQYESLRSSVEAKASSVPEEQLDHEALLYRRLCAMMQEEQLYKDAELNREVLATRLGTNYNYVADAVRNHGGGATVGEFINGYRLRMAASLLMECPDLTVGEVEYRSGFNSRSTFFRLFRDCYGMSPTEYRRISKAKAKE